MFVVYKKLGETPLACLERTRQEHNIEKTIPMTYAGRLDPMAEGLLILLVGDECKEKPQWTKLPKTYEFDILVGFKTDTDDLLGLVVSTFDKISMSGDLTRRLEILSDDLSNVLGSFLGEQIQTYPKYSSKTVDGTSLFTHTRNGATVELPTHTIHIDTLEAQGTTTLSVVDFKKILHDRITLVQGDFRQDDILKTWDRVLDTFTYDTVQIIHCVVSCSSGTYVRQLVSDIGEKIGVPLVTFSIKRTQVGDFIL